MATYRPKGKIDPVKLKAQFRRQKAKIRGVEYSEGLAASYAVPLVRLVRRITRAALERAAEMQRAGLVHDADLSSFVNTKTQEEIGALQAAVVVIAIKRVDKYHREKFVKEFKDKAGIDLKRIIKAEKLEVELAQRIKDNMSLVTKATSEQYDKLNEAFNRAIMSGQEAVSLDTMIADIGSAFESRAKLIARDQTSKFISALNSARQQNIGIPGYYWRTTGDERVRPDHAALEGQYFAWADMTPIGLRPGEDIQCRCVADPAIDKFMEWLPENE